MLAKEILDEITSSYQKWTDLLGITSLANDVTRHAFIAGYHAGASLAAQKTMEAVTKELEKSHATKNR